MLFPRNDDRFVFLVERWQYFQLPVFSRVVEAAKIRLDETLFLLDVSHECKAGFGSLLRFFIIIVLIDGSICFRNAGRPRFNSRGTQYLCGKKFTTRVEAGGRVHVVTS